MQGETHAGRSIRRNGADCLSVGEPSIRKFCFPRKKPLSANLAEIDGQQHQADNQVQRSLIGEADIHEATLALEKADLSLKLLVQVRNKLVSAYEELSRMSM